MFGRSRLPRSRSRNGVGPCWLTTRIISSGVTPLAVSAADERARARADVDVEVVDGPVDRQQIERAQRADLVDAAGEAAAAEHERGLRALARGGAAAGSSCGSSLTTLPISGVYGRCGAGCAAAGAPPTAPCCCVRAMRRLSPPCSRSPRRSPARPGRRDLEPDLRAIAREMRLARWPPAPTCAIWTPARSSSRCARTPSASRPRSRSSSRPRPRCCGSDPRRRCRRSPSSRRRDRRAGRDAARRSRARRRRRSVLRRRVRPAAGAAVRAAGIRRIDGAVIGDESVFDDRRSGCCAGFDPDLGGVLSALAYDRGVYRGRARLDAARFAAGRFGAVLDAAGVTRRARAGAGPAPENAKTIALLPSRSVSELARFINVPSNNFAAEMLSRARRALPRRAARWPRGAGSCATRSTTSACARGSSTARGCRATTAPRRARSCACSSG